jgi:hypothetical protein
VIVSPLYLISGHSIPLLEDVTLRCCTYDTSRKPRDTYRDQPTIMNLTQHASHPTNGIRKEYHTQCVAIIRALKLVYIFPPLFTQRNPLDWIFFLDQSSFFPPRPPLAPSPTLAYHLLRTITFILSMLPLWY